MQDIQCFIRRAAFIRLAVETAIGKLADGEPDVRLSLTRNGEPLNLVFGKAMHEGTVLWTVRTTDIDLFAGQPPTFTFSCPAGLDFTEEFVQRILDFIAGQLGNEAYVKARVLTAGYGNVSHVRLVGDTNSCELKPSYYSYEL